MPKQNTKPFSRLVKWFNATGLIHTLISISVFVLSLLFILYEDSVFRTATQILSTITLFNSVIWLICAFVMIIVAHRLKAKNSVAKTRILLILSIFFVLAPDILLVILLYLPQLKDATWVYILGMINPLLVFIGWFIGKRIGKGINK